MARYKTPFMLACIVLLATALRVYQIDRESFWLDEAFSYWVANSTAADVGITSANEVNPPLYYITLHYWVKIFGDSDKAIRLLSAMLGSLAIPVIYQIGRLLFNERFGLLAALFLTVSGFHIQYAQEARAYSLYFLLTSLSVFFVVLTSKKRTYYASIGYILTTALYRCRYYPLLLGIGVALEIVKRLPFPYGYLGSISCICAIHSCVPKPSENGERGVLDTRINDRGCSDCLTEIDPGAAIYFGFGTDSIWIDWVARRHPSFVSSCAMG